MVLSQTDTCVMTKKKMVLDAPRGQNLCSGMKNIPYTMYTHFFGKKVGFSGLYGEAGVRAWRRE
jgi:hypothetical protein